MVTGLSNAKGTQSRFRNEAERFTLFCWHERGKSVLDTKLEDVKLYIDWIWSPPKKLIADTTISSRFKFRSNSDIRVVNPEWRPFVHRTPKANRKIESLIAPGKVSSTKHAYKISQTWLFLNKTHYSRIANENYLHHVALRYLPI